MTKRNIVHLEWKFLLQMAILWVIIGGVKQYSVHVCKSFLGINHKEYNYLWIVGQFNSNLCKYVRLTTSFIENSGQVDKIQSCILATYLIWPMPFLSKCKVQKP